MVIKVLGTGCKKCKTLEKNAIKAVSILGKDIPVIKIESLEEIMAMGVMSTPGLVVDETIISTGRVPKAKEIVELIENL